MFAFHLAAWDGPIVTSPARNPGPQGRNEVSGRLTNFQLDYMVTSTQREEFCPSLTGAIGAALGWMGIIEFCATLLFFALLRTTILHPVKKDASFLNLLRGAGLNEVIEEVKDSLKEAISAHFVEATGHEATGEDENEAQGQEALDTLSSEASAVVSSTSSQTISFKSDQPMGVGIKQQGDNVVFATVDAGTPAAKVPVGSKIIAVNETSCTGLSKDDVVGAIKAAKAAAPSFKITVDTSGTEGYEQV